MLFGGAETDHQIQWRIAAFHKGRQELGWTAGQNIQVVLRWVPVIPIEFMLLQRNWLASTLT